MVLNILLCFKELRKGLAAGLGSSLGFGSSIPLGLLSAENSLANGFPCSEASASELESSSARLS